MSKPVFLLWAHRLMWDILAKNPTMSKIDAFRELLKQYPDCPKPLCYCFACGSAAKKQSVGRCEYCPLGWGDDLRFYPTCACSGTPYQKWASAVDNGESEQASAYAVKVRDIDLSKNAYKLYDIKEVPGEY